MNKLLLTLISGVFVLFAGSAFCTITDPAPTDSVTSLVDKTAATVILENGKTLYGQGKIKDALIKFREAGVKDPYSWRAPFWISKCHYRLNNYGYALKYANKAVDLGKDKVNKEIYFTLASAHHRMQNIDSAIVYYEKSNEVLNKLRSNELLVDHHIVECNFAKEQLKSAPKFEKQRLIGDINSGYDDYSALLVDGGKSIYFVSRRSNTTGGGMNPDDQRYFEDVYKTTWDDELGEWDNITNKLGKVNSRGFDALNYISPDGLFGIMTLNSTATDAKTTTRGSDLCELKMSKKGTWNSPRIINNKTINTSFFEGAATVTADGNTMYFVTDRKGQKSSTDIYVVERNGKSWGNAKPLPFNVNSKGRETTPYITPDGRYLFFSSDGHTGMGGLDIYVTENLGDEWSTPVNLGHGINTVNNDSHFTYYPDMKKALMSAIEITGNKSSIDIYEVDMSTFEYPKAQ